MPYETSGSITTDERSVAVSETWDSQTDWEAYQSATNVDITSGVVTLAETSVIPPSGVSRWTFDDADTSSGIALDVWGDNDGTINGATTGVSGQYNQAYSFDGVDDNVVVPHTTELNPSASGISVAAWVKTTDNTSPGPGIVGKVSSAFSNGYQLFYDGDGGQVPYFTISDSSDNQYTATATTSVGTGNWEFVAAVIDLTSNESRIYVNGSRDATETITTWDGITTTSDLLIGEFGPASGRYFTGDIDDPRVYDEPLTDAEVSNLYNTGSI